MDNVGSLCRVANTTFLPTWLYHLLRFYLPVRAGDWQIAEKGGGGVDYPIDGENLTWVVDYAHYQACRTRETSHHSAGWTGRSWRDAAKKPASPAKGLESRLNPALFIQQQSAEIFIAAAVSQSALGYAPDDLDKA